LAANVAAGCRYGWKSVELTKVANWLTVKSFSPFARERQWLFVHFDFVLFFGCVPKPSELVWAILFFVCLWLSAWQRMVRHPAIGSLGRCIAQLQPGFSAPAHSVLMSSFGDGEYHQ
jgi:hypothetical protein